MKNLQPYKNYRNFISGRYLNEGVRITAGIVLPALLMSYFDMLTTGIVFSLGALCVSVTDSPGPVHHRLNGMLYCNVLITIMSIIAGYAASSHILLALMLAVFGFLFSMLTVYGVRTSSVGIAGLIVMILSLQTPMHGWDIWEHGVSIFIGGTWYLLFSLLLYKIRPYKIIQQVLGDFIMDVGEYLKTRGLFYDTNPEYDKTYQLLLQEQINVQAEQTLLSDILFKTRTIVKESTPTSRVLLKIYVDVAELFESIMTTFQDYKLLHQQFDETGILEEYGNLIHSLADEMNDIGLAVKSGLHSTGTNANFDRIRQIREHYESLRANYMSYENLESFIALGRILNNLQHLTEKINGLHHYTSYDKKIQKIAPASIEHSNYAETQDIRPAIFFDNLSFKSNTFRHSLRVAIALLVGYGISLFFNIGHNYWILLTIVVILKPAYSLTKKRNANRLMGTFLGILIGVLVLYLTGNKTLLLIIMVFFMAMSYAFLRTSYFVSVLFMTPYLVIFFHLLYPSALNILLQDRIVDTAIGSVISFFASIFFVPVWEHESIRTSMIRLLEANKKYYALIANAFSNKAVPVSTELKFSRREVLTSLANVSDAFNRMLSEPKRFQKGIKAIHQFVVLNHILTGHFATLSYYLNVRQNSFRSADLLPVIENTQLNFSNAVHQLLENQGTLMVADRNSLNKLNEYADAILKIRKEEIRKGQLETDTKKELVKIKSVVDQFNYIYGISADISRVAADAVA